MKYAIGFFIGIWGFDHSKFELTRRLKEYTLKMEGQIVLANAQLLDVLLRGVIVGVLLVIFVLFALKREKHYIPNLCLISCIIGYVLLTLPVEDSQFGLIRSPLMFLSNMSIYPLLAVYWFKTRNRSLLTVLPKWSYFPLCIWFIWLTYYFIVQVGYGTFRLVHLGFSFCILLGVLIDAILDFDDDLDAQRRDFRWLTFFLISTYMVVLTLIELLFKDLIDEPQFSLLNAFGIFLVCIYFSIKLLHSNFNGLNFYLSKVDKPDKAKNIVLSEDHKQILSKLEAAMQGGIYVQNGLTIGKLANVLELPEYKIRQVINQALGFNNFSQYLNSYRIPTVCKKLEQTQYNDTPILTLALEAGYNSIAPFNRAFKEHTNMTPTQYKQSFYDQN